VGGDCSADVVGCQSFTACDPVTHKCVAASRPGQLCANYVGIEYAFCRGASVCRSGDDDVRRCVTLVEDGGACAHEIECRSRICTNGICAVMAPNDGAPCDNPSQCSSGICNYAMGVCVARYANGADCTSDGFCMSGWCSGGKCTPTGATGAACAVGSQCASGHCAAGTFADCP
jgi:hypothetical protein